MPSRTHPPIRTPLPPAGGRGLVSLISQWKELAPSPATPSPRPLLGTRGHFPGPRQKPGSAQLGSFLKVFGDLCFLLTPAGPLE